MFGAAVVDLVSEMRNEPSTFQLHQVDFGNPRCNALETLFVIPQ
jgi:hypothetical protein